MSMNLALTKGTFGKSDYDDFTVYQTPTNVTMAVVQSSDQKKRAEGYLAYVRSEVFDLPVIPQNVRSFLKGNYVLPAEFVSHFGGDRRMRPFYSKVSALQDYLEHEEEILKAVSRGYSFSMT